MRIRKENHNFGSGVGNNAKYVLADNTNAHNTVTVVLYTIVHVQVVKLGFQIRL